MVLLYEETKGRKIKSFQLTVFAINFYAILKLLFPTEPCAKSLSWLGWKEIQPRIKVISESCFSLLKNLNIFLIHCFIHKSYSCKQKDNIIHWTVVAESVTKHKLQQFRALSISVI